MTLKGDSSLLHTHTHKLVMCDPANKGLRDAATETLMNNEQPNSDLMTSVCKTAQHCFYGCSHPTALITTHTYRRSCVSCSQKHDSSVLVCQTTKITRMLLSDESHSEKSPKTLPLARNSHFYSACMHYDGSDDPQTQTVCVLLQESNHTFVLCFTFFFYIHLFIYNHL